MTPVEFATAVERHILANPDLKKPESSLDRFEFDRTTGHLGLWFGLVFVDDRELDTFLTADWYKMVMRGRNLLEEARELAEEYLKQVFLNIKNP